MTDLIAWISSEKATFAHVKRVIDEEEWERIYLVCNQDFDKQIENVELIKVDNRQMLPQMTEEIKNALKDKVRIMESAVNIISGSGKEHMALLSALLKLGAGIRLVAFTKEGVKEI